MPTMPTQDATREHIERRSTPPMGDTTPQETRVMQGRGEGDDPQSKPKKQKRKPPPNGHCTRRTPREIEEKVMALTAMGYSRRQVADALGLPNSTVQSIVTRLENEESETFAQLRAAQKREWVRKAWEAVEHLTIAATRGAQRLAAESDDLTARDVRDLAVAAGILVDKSALVLGETAQTGSGGGLTRDIADAVLSAWHAGREEGRREASPRNITPGKLIDA